MKNFAIKDNKTDNYLKFIGRDGKLTDKEGAYLYETEKKAQDEIDKMGWNDWAIIDEI
jgi:hypothetical protein